MNHGLPPDMRKLISNVHNMHAFTSNKPHACNRTYLENIEKVSVVLHEGAPHLSLPTSKAKVAFTIVDQGLIRSVTAYQDGEPMGTPVLSYWGDAFYPGKTVEVSEREGRRWRKVNLTQERGSQSRTIPTIYPNGNVMVWPCCLVNLGEPLARERMAELGWFAQKEEVLKINRAKRASKQPPPAPM